MLDKLTRSVLEQDRAAIVICNLEHVIVYMNKAAERSYAKRGGKALLGKCLLNCHNEKSNEMIKKVVDWFRESTDNNMIYTSRDEEKNKDIYMVALRDENNELIGYYEKHEHRDRESVAMYDFSQSLV